MTTAGAQLIQTDRFHVITAVDRLRGASDVRTVGEVNPERARPDEATLKTTHAAMAQLVGREITSVSAAPTPDPWFMSMVGGIIESVELHEAEYQNGALVIYFADGRQYGQDQTREPVIFEADDELRAVRIPGTDRPGMSFTLDNGRRVEIEIDRSCERSETYATAGQPHVLPTPPSIKATVHEV